MKLLEETFFLENDKYLVSIEIETPNLLYHKEGFYHHK